MMVCLPSQRVVEIKVSVLLVETNGLLKGRGRVESLFLFQL